MGRSGGQLHVNVWRASRSIRILSRIWPHTPKRRLPASRGRPQVLRTAASSAAQPYDSKVSATASVTSARSHVVMQAVPWPSARHVGRRRATRCDGRARSAGRLRSFGLPLLLGEPIMLRAAGQRGRPRRACSSPTTRLRRQASASPDCVWSVQAVPRYPRYASGDAERAAMHARDVRVTNLLLSLWTRRRCCLCSCNTRTAVNIDALSRWKQQGVELLVNVDSRERADLRWLNA